MKDFRDIKAWQKAHLLTLEVYETTKGFPKEEVYGLTSQMRRASLSIPTNIAEGCGRNTDTEFARFLEIAMGSACELEYLLLLSQELKLLDEITYSNLTATLIEIKQMLTSFILRLRGKLKAEC